MLATTADAAERDLNHVARLIARLLEPACAGVARVDATGELVAAASWPADAPDGERLAGCLSALIGRGQTPFLIADARLEGGLDAVGSWAAACLGVSMEMAAGDGCIVTWALDTRPRRWSEDDAAALRELGALGAAIAARAGSKRVIDGAPIGIGLISPAGRWLKANRALSGMLGYAAHELVGRSLSDLIHPDERAPGLPGRGRIERRLYHRAGMAVWAELSFAELPGGGEGGAAIVLVREITAEREAREALALSERRHQSIAAGVPGVVFRLVRRPDGRLELPFASAGARAGTGIAAEPTRGADVARVLGGSDPEDRRAWLSSLEASARALTRWEWRGRHVGPDGTVRYLHGAAEPQREPDGTVIWDGLMLDETGERAAEAARREAELRFRRTFEDAPIGMVLVAGDGRITEANQALCAMTGHGAPALRALEPFALVHPGERAEVRQAFASLGDWRDTVTVEHRIVHASGQAVWVLTQATLLHDGAGRPLQVLAHVQDVTARREHEAWLEASRDQALGLSELKSQFVANMSHEIRTPLGGMISAAQLLLETSLSDEQRQLAGIASTSARTLLRVINDILDFSKIEAGMLEIIEEDFELGSALAEPCELLRFGAEEKGLALHWSLEPGLPEVLRGDGSRLRQILLNLVGNAVKFTRAGAIEVRARAVESVPPRLRIEVLDTGTGIAGDRLARLFEPFAQADATTSRQYGGTGLGLSISKQLVELMGGRIGAESRLGEGSTFWIELPCVAGEPAAVPPPVALGERRAAEPGPGAQRVLVAEDNEINQIMARRILERLGYEVELAATGREAIELAARERYAAIFMDCHMPELDGYEATRAIRAAEGAGRRTPIIAMTANTMSGDRERCLEAGMDDYLPKPIPIEALSALCRRLLGAGSEPGPGAAHPLAERPRSVFEPTTLGQFGSPAEVRPILAIFLEDLGPSLEALDGAVAAGDLPETERVAHRLAGSAATVGAEQLAGACRQVCAACRNGEPAVVLTWHGVLRAAAGATQAAIAAHLAAAVAA